MKKNKVIKSTIEDARKIIQNAEPIEIKNQQAYDSYIKLHNNPIYKNKIVEVSTGQKVSLGLLQHNFIDKIKNLPKQEQEKLFARKKLFKKLVCKMNGYKRKAYGTKSEINEANRISSEQVMTAATLFDQREKDMIELFGRMFTAQEVLRVCVETWGIPVKLDAVKEFRTKHWKQIEPRIENHKRTYTDIRLGYKRSRLEELVYIYNIRKRIHDDHWRGEDHRLLLQTLEQIRKEVEGDTIRIDGQFNINLEQTLEDHLQREIRRTLPLKEIIMGRIAARMGVKPEIMIAEMNKAYYSKYLEAEDLSYEELPPYPSNQNYDFERIRKSNEQQKKREQNKKPEEEVSVKVIEGATTLRESILQKLRQKREQVNYSRGTVQSNSIDRSNDSINYNKEE